MTDYTVILATFSLAYCLGSIPFGLILARLFKLGDLRRIGSGNIGATNVMRTGRRGIALLTLVLDGGKGYAAVVFARDLYTGDLAQVAGLFAVLGHVFPVWLRFKGGKGVATTIGVFFALNWMLGASVCALWLAAFLFIHISSIAALLSITYSTLCAYILTSDSTELLCLALALIILFTHRQNIQRLLEGTELAFKRKVAI